MAHRPICLQNISLSYPHKTCFENFSAEIHPGQRIGIIGRNGSGKTSLLRIIQNCSNIATGYVPQIIEDFASLSGAQKFNQSLSIALAKHPELLCLDEPTNHLDTKNRRSLIRMLQNFEGTLVLVSHDVQLLRNCVDILWHIEDGRIEIFSGSYDAFLEIR